MKWEKGNVFDLCVINPENVSRNYPYDFIRYFDITSVGSGVVSINDEIPLSEAPSRARRVVRNNDTIIATVRPGNKSFYYFKTAFENSVASTGFAVLRPKKNITDPRFLYYLISEPGFTAYLVAYEQGANYPSVNPDIIGGKPIEFPPLPTQRKIAGILSAYDDLIENNLKRIKLLEEKAFLRYKGIVRSDKMERKKLKDVLDLKYGKALKADDRKDGKYPVYGSSGEVGTHEEFYIEGPGIIVGRKGNIGSVYWSHKNFWPIDTVYFVESELSFYFLYFNLKEQNFVNTDAAVPGLNRNFALDNWIQIPPRKIAEEFDYETKPIFQFMNVLRNQNAKLREARDILLPRLMSGEIGV